MSSTGAEEREWQTRRRRIDGRLQAHQARHGEVLANVAWMVKDAADDQQPLLTAKERVDRAIGKITPGQQFAAEQQAWLERIRSHLIENLSIGREDFDDLPVFAREGGWGAASRALDDPPTLLRKCNELVAA